MRVFITGDTHRKFDRIEKFCLENKTTKDDLMIILGDAGINYFLNDRDYAYKKYLSSLPITFFFIHGNHEERPEKIKTYNLIFDDMVHGLVYIENEFPSLLFAKDDFLYGINDKCYYVFGGGCSVDKYYRLTTGMKWFPSEINHKLVKNINKLLDTGESTVDYLINQTNITFGYLTHTCPLKYEPEAAKLEGVDESTVDKSLEKLFDRFDNMGEYDTWYCGHWHTDKKGDRIRFMYKDIEEIK